MWFYDVVVLLLIVVDTLYVVATILVSCWGQLGGLGFVAHFRKGGACDSAFFSIHQHGANFGLSDERYHMLFEYYCMAKKWDIGQGYA
jgi:hypothetical protein